MNTFVAYQNDILEFWKKHNMPYMYYINKPNKFRFIAGPPFPTGSPHFGHIAIETIKSTVLNYKSMNGFMCDNKLGYDCHGVPIESIANRDLNINNLEDLERIGINKFNQYCKDTIKRFEGDWEPVYNNMGRWADFTNVYKTMDREFMESVWWAFAELYNKGLIYRGYKITPYSYPLQSPLSNFEASQGYKDVDCRSIYIKFQITQFSPQFPDNILNKLTDKSVYLVAWTTTPWTLPANLALCVNPELDYEVVETDNSQVYILGKDTIKNTGVKASCVLGIIKGSQLIGTKYQPLYNSYLALMNIEISKSLGVESNPPFDALKWFTVVADDYVKHSEGTGTCIVHLAPVFGEDDYRVCKEQNLITDTLVKDIEIIDKNCRYTVSITNTSTSTRPTTPSTPNYTTSCTAFCVDNILDVSKYNTQLVFDVETEIIKQLKEKQYLVKTQQFRHEYPYCYRTDTPLVYRTCESFYVNVQLIKDRMIELNRETNWYPENTGSQRFHNWLEGAKDWCISRSRYFGTPIPAWICEADGSMLIISSIKQLEELTKQKFIDIHPEYVNDVEITDSETGKTYKRVSDVFDCWFESGSVPFAQYHYPFENKSMLEKMVQREKAMGDFIAEGIDQTRGWFYTLLIISTALFDVKPAKNIMSIGHILDEHRKKLSKKNKNYVDPNIIIQNYGADSIRLYMLQSPITTGQPLAFKEEDIKNLNKELFQFKNCVDFLLDHTTNQRHHNVVFDPLAFKNTENSMDKWIIVHLNEISKQICTLMDDYQVAKATRILIDVIEDITNWYVKFNRDRLKGKSGNAEWIISTSVLYQVIMRYITLLAPFAPVICQYVYGVLDGLSSTNTSNNTNTTESRLVHYENYNTIIQLDITESDSSYYLETFELLKRVSKMVRAARMRSKTHSSVKTPIKSCEICMDSPVQLQQIAGCIDLIQSELNVLDMKYSGLEQNLAYRYIPNRAVLGKKYKKDANKIYKLLDIFNMLSPNNLKDITLTASSIDLDNIITLCAKDSNINSGDDSVLTYVLKPEDYTKEPVFGDHDIYDTNILVKIDFTYDASIEAMTHLKRLIAKIQQDRKHMGLKIWNRILVEFVKDDFNVVTSNIETIKTRLECDLTMSTDLSKTVTTHSYVADEDDSRQITYSIIIL